VAWERELIPTQIVRCVRATEIESLVLEEGGYCVRRDSAVIGLAVCLPGAKRDLPSAGMPCAPSKSSLSTTAVGGLNGGSIARATSPAASVVIQAQAASVRAETDANEIVCRIVTLACQATGTSR
jgi:hypothetical protein